jgi:hypothetical protein
MAELPGWIVALATPDNNDDDEEESVIDTSKLKDDEGEVGGVASGADSAAWTYSPADGKPDNPQ